MATNATAIDGVIRADETYVKAAFLPRVGMKEAGFRTARRAGLRVIYTNGRCYIRGADWFAYLDRLASQQTPEPAEASRRVKKLRRAVCQDIWDFSARVLDLPP